MRLLFVLSLVGVLSVQTRLIHAQGIYKCVVNGNTAYSDVPCSGNAARKPIELHHAAGIVSPDRDTVTDTVNRMYDERWANAVPGRSITRTTTRNGNTTTHTVNNALPKERVAAPSDDKKVRCQSFSDRVDHLDAMGRQYQTGRKMDWIRQERQKARDGEFRLGC
jgi:hypothetical protein